MAKTATIVTLGQVTGVSATAEAGGSLPIGVTYYYKVFAICSPLSSDSSDTFKVVEGIASTEVSATTDATNRKIKIEWSALTGAQKYCVVRTATSGDYTQGTCKCIGNSTASYLTYWPTGTSHYDDGVNLVGNVRISPNGCIAIVIDGGTTSDRITLDWIYGQLNSAGHAPTYIDRYLGVADSYATYHFKDCSLLAGYSSGNPTYWKMENGVAVIMKGNIRVGTYSDFITGTLTSGGGTNGATILYNPKSITSTSFYWSGLFNFYGAKIMDVGISFAEVNVSNYYGAVTSLIAFTGTEAISGLFGQSQLIDCFLEGGSGNSALSGNILVRNGVGSFQSRLESSQGNFPIYSNVVLNHPTSIRTYSYGSYYIETTFICQTAKMHQFYHGGASRKVFAFKDCVWNGTAEGVSGSSNPTYTQYMELFSVNIGIQDEDGIPLEGAKVYISDKNGYVETWVGSYSISGTPGNTGLGATATTLTLASTTGLSIGDMLMFEREKLLITQVNSATQVTVSRGQEGTWDNRLHVYRSSAVVVYKRVPYVETNANGNIPEQIIMQHSYTYNAVATPKYDKVVYSPFTFTISKSKYKTHTSKFTFSKKFDEIITLKKTKPVVDEDGKYHITNDNNGNLIREDGKYFVEI